MANTISNFKGYFNRTYKEAGVIKHEGRREMAQFPNVNDRGTNLNNKFRAYSMNAPYSNYYYTEINTRLSNGATFASYEPGNCYIPENGYTIDDIFPEGYFTNEGGLQGYINLVIDLIFTDQYFNTSFRDVKFNDNYAFWIDDEHKFFAQWELYISKTSNSGGVPKKATIDIAIGFAVYDSSKIEQSKLTISAPNRELPYYYDVMYYSDSGDIIKLNSSNGLIREGDSGIIFHFRNYDYLTQGEIIDAVSEYLKVLRKQKIYFAPGYVTYDVTIDNVLYFYTNEREYTEHPRYIQIVNDISSAPYFPTSGFYTKLIFNGSTNFNNAFTLDYESGGPDSKKPDDKDDPNDEDDPPNPDDEGGDGDHDNTDDDIDPPPIPTISASGAGLVTIFSPSQAELTQLGAKLWNPTALEAIKQYFTNPLDTVLGLSIIPVKPKTGSSAEILLGIYETGITAPLVDSDYVIIDCGSIPITRYYGSYLDYSPYTKIKCYLPYIGEVDVSPDEAMQTTLNIKYYVNVVTGDTVAMLLLNGSIFYTATGNCARQIPLSSADYSSIINTAVNAVSGIAAAFATAGVGAASVAAVSAKRGTEAAKELASKKATANNIGSSASLVGDVTNAKMHYQHAGSLGTGAGQLCYQKPYLIIERPNLDLASNYKSFVGYPCNKTMQLSRCKGFTQVEATNIFVRDATDVELSMIKELLLEGVIF